MRSDNTTLPATISQFWKQTCELIWLRIVVAYAREQAIQVGSVENRTMKN